MKLKIDPYEILNIFLDVISDKKLLETMDSLYCSNTLEDFTKEMLKLDPFKSSKINKDILIVILTFLYQRADEIYDNFLLTK